MLGINLRHKQCFIMTNLFGQVGSLNGQISIFLFSFKSYLTVKLGATNEINSAVTCR